MAGDGGHAPERDYRLARIAVAGLLTVAVVVLLLADAASEAYDVSPVVLVALLGTIAALLGIEGLRFLGGGR